MSKHHAIKADDYKNTNPYRSYYFKNRHTHFYIDHKLHGTWARTKTSVTNQIRSRYRLFPEQTTKDKLFQSQDFF